MYTLFKMRMLFFRARLNIPIFLPILAWKYSCIILELYNNLKRKNLSFPFRSLFIFFPVNYRYVFHVPFIELLLAMNSWL